MIPLFIIGFAAMSLLRTVGDMGERPFGVLDPAQWKAIVGFVKQVATYCLAIAMAAVGLGTSIKGLRAHRPQAAGGRACSPPCSSGVVSFTLVKLLY